jgi:hypothetical protein
MQVARPNSPRHAVPALAAAPRGTRTSFANSRNQPVCVLPSVDELDSVVQGCLCPRYHGQDTAVPQLLSCVKVPAMSPIPQCSMNAPAWIAKMSQEVKRSAFPVGATPK